MALKHEVKGSKRAFENRSYFGGLAFMAAFNLASKMAAKLSFQSFLSSLVIHNINLYIQCKTVEYIQASSLQILYRTTLNMKIEKINLKERNSNFQIPVIKIQNFK